MVQELPTAMTVVIVCGWVSGGARSVHQFNVQRSALVGNGFKATMKGTSIAQDWIGGHTTQFVDRQTGHCRHKANFLIFEIRDPSPWIILRHP